MTERILLSKTEDFEIFAEISIPLKPQGSVSLKILTRWLNAKNPEDCQAKFSMLLDREAVNNMETLIKHIKKELK